MKLYTAFCGLAGDSGHKVFIIHASSEAEARDILEKYSYLRHKYGVSIEKITISKDYPLVEVCGYDNPDYEG